MIRAVLLALVLVPLAPAAAQVFDFESDQPGRPPAGFDFATTGGVPGGRWEVVEAEGGRALAQVDDDPSRWRFAMAIVADRTVRDVTLSVRGKATSGEVDRAIGLVWRWQGPDDYYLARANALERNVRVYRVVGGNRVKFAGVEDLDLASGRWYVLAVEHVGETIRVSLDGRAVLEVRDGALPAPGKVGLWVKADSVTWFDDLRIESRD